MAIRINQKPAPYCLENCPYKDLDIHKTSLYADGEVTKIVDTVSCENENVCRMWYEYYKNLNQHVE